MVLIPDGLLSILRIKLLLSFCGVLLHELLIVIHEILPLHEVFLLHVVMHNGQRSTISHNKLAFNLLL